MPNKRLVLNFDNKINPNHIMRNITNAGFLLLIITLFSVSFSFAQKSPKEYTDKFFEIYTQKSVNEAVDFLYQDNPWKENIQDAINNIKEKLTGLNSRLGTYHGQVKIGEKNLKDTFVVIHYLIKYERQPLRFEFKFYKPNDEWKVYGFSYDDGISQELSNSLNVQFLELDKSLDRSIEELKKIGGTN